jgi:PIN domain nuclease of toxin-antitoxin system
MAVKQVLDTHALVWYLEGNPRLGAAAKAAIDDPRSELVLPLIALAEATYIVERGRTSIPDVANLLERVGGDSRIDIYPVTMSVFRRSLSLSTIPELHDRLIVATALEVQRAGHAVALLTKDSVIVPSGFVPIIW